MRPLRLICTAAFLVVAGFFLLLSFLQPLSNDNDSSDTRQRSDYRSRWSFGAPASLFPPSAIISLTDDNTTFFLARPALYGPALPADGLSGQLWVGSGFGDDTLVRGGMLALGQAELGCSDIPGWSEERIKLPSPSLDSSNGKPVANDESEGKSQQTQSNIAPDETDDTDNFLHYPLRGVPFLKNIKQDTGSSSTHADIQSLQESAAISGKVVLLSRGGCGFLEKTKWVERRGGVALIVGDYTRGGHLIQMSAHEDTGNITIPSIFTAYTSAHLLSSLVPSRSKSDDIDLDRSKKQMKNIVAGSAFATFPEAPKTTKSPLFPSGSETKPQVLPTLHSKQSKSSWLSAVGHKLGLVRRDTNNKADHRSSSNGAVSWVQSSDWDDENPDKPARKFSNKEASQQAHKAASKADLDDDFVIGVHDWRDPDMVAHPKDKQSGQKGQDQGKPVEKENKKSNGSRAPESGVYKPVKQDSKISSDPKTPSKDSTSDESSWLHGLLGSTDTKHASLKENQKAQDMYKKKIAPHFVQDQEFEDDKRKEPVEHEGLWITMTPTSVSANPFFDTLLVLVVSPLVTLSIVYALLLLRSRIRRRRWRAPRSVVDRLPVRTYQTMSYSSSNTTSHAPSPHTSNPTTPLLPTAIPRPRPRSATISNIRQEATASYERATAGLSSREKNSPTSNNAFKRKFKGRQIECVVCLEEYVDGHSQVMSLPCGHEFHVECITPWLTTRRRTCPICKGDVVRSMENSSTPSTTNSSYTSLVLLGETSTPHDPLDVSSPQSQSLLVPNSPINTTRQPQPITDSSSPTLQASIAETRNESPTSAIPIPAAPTSATQIGNLAGDDLASTLVGSRQTGDGIFTPPQIPPRRQRRER